MLQLNVENTIDSREKDPKCLSPPPLSKHTTDFLLSDLFSRFSFLNGRFTMKPTLQKTIVFRQFRQNCLYVAGWISFVWQHETKRWQFLFWKDNTLVPGQGILSRLVAAHVSISAERPLLPPTHPPLTILYRKVQFFNSRKPLNIERSHTGRVFKACIDFCQMPIAA